MLLGVVHGVLEEFFFGCPADDMRAAGRWIYLGALEHLPHDGSSSARERLARRG
jgi:hypothetical protein